MLVGGWSQKETAPANNRYDNVVGVAAAALLSFLALSFSLSLSLLCFSLSICPQRSYAVKRIETLHSVFFVVVMFFLSKVKVKANAVAVLNQLRGNNVSLKCVRSFYFVPLSLQSPGFLAVCCASVLFNNTCRDFPFLLLLCFTIHTTQSAASEL